MAATPTSQRRRFMLAAAAAGILVTSACSGSMQQRTTSTNSADTTTFSQDVSDTGTVADTVNPSRRAATTPAASTTPSGSASSLTTTPAAQPLRGKVIVIDPGHNGGNAKASQAISRQVAIGNGTKACDTTGTQTNSGYPEPAFTWDMSTRIAQLVRQQGARVVLTRPNNSGVGPCITVRAKIGNDAKADAAISIHADGAPASGRGFHVIAPRAAGGNAAIVAPSKKLAYAIRDAYARGSGIPLSTYTGGGQALTFRDDLGGLNLSRVPKVFLETGNMRNSADAAALRNPAWRQRAAAAIVAGLTAYLTPAR